MASDQRIIYEWWRLCDITLFLTNFISNYSESFKPIYTLLVKVQMDCVLPGPVKECPKKRYMAPTSWRLTQYILTFEGNMPNISDKLII